MTENAITKEGAPEEREKRLYKINVVERMFFVDDNLFLFLFFSERSPEKKRL